MKPNKPSPHQLPTAGPELLQRLSALTGLRLEEGDLQRVRSALAGIDQSDADDRQQLASALIPLESFFFRDAGQVALIRERLLPQRIRVRAASRTLRLWSAGCATGEEAYTLAILLAELLPDLHSWKIDIVASDINRHALERARSGLYGAWSFRGVPDSVRARHFRAVRGGWQIEPALRDMVTFVEDDLLGSPVPALLSGEFDLVLCRHVLMYYQDEALARVVDRFARALAPGGFLLVGHVEMIRHSHPLLGRMAFPESAVYFREKGGVPAIAPVVPSPASTRPVAATSPTLPPVSLAQPSLTAASAYTTSVSGAAIGAGTGTDTGTGKSDSLPELADELQAAWRLADRGELARAAICCEQLVHRQPLAAGPYYLQAHLAQERGEWQRAHALLDRVLYLDPQCVMAWFDLAALCSLEGDTDRSMRLQQIATGLLERLPPDALLPPKAEVSAGEMLAALNGVRPSTVSYL
ncbi:MAG: hypothetical protein RL404_2385 [Pseudomonadota bacterium]|jgi:chemotaxis protein methyltransferase CheR